MMPARPELQPVVFVSHGAPDVLFKAPGTVSAWATIAQSMPRPKAILVISAHWLARVPTVSLAGAPATLHDFDGFDRRLATMSYPSPGAPLLAERVAALLTDAGLGAALHPGRGLDHGAWIPLRAMYPDASVPVTQVALPVTDQPKTYWAMGQALSALRQDGALILASGAITHNFSWIDWAGAEGGHLRLEAAAFAEWVASELAENRPRSLMDYEQHAYGRTAHPTPEHFAPLLVAAAAASGDLCNNTPVPERLQPPPTYGALAMDAYVWA